MSKEKLIIDSEFKSLCPPLSEEELSALEESLKREGCRNSLTVWKGRILDGYHRHKLCTAHDIEFKTQEMKFEDRTEAKIWIINNQFARRNLRAFQRCELALKLKPLISAQAKEHQRLSKGRGKKGLLKKINLIDTEKELAKIARVSKSRMNQVSYTLEHGNKEELHKAREGDEPVGYAYTRIKHRIKRADSETQRKEHMRKFKRDSTLIEGEPGARIKYYTDKWGNECYEKRRPWAWGIKKGSKTAEICSMGYVKYDSEYKKVKDNEAEFALRFPLDQLFYKIKDCERELSKLIKKYPINIIQKAYEFDNDADDLRSAKKYLWSEFLRATKSFIKVLDRLEESSESDDKG